MTAAGRTPCIGREQELRVLGEVLDQAEQGHFVSVFVEGEAGIGKSRLLQDATARAAARGFHVLCGSSEELERTLPFGAIRTLLRADALSENAEAAALAAVVLDTLVSTKPEGVDLRYRVVEDVVNMVAKLSATATVVVAVDDLHWADSSSLLVLSEIARRLPHLPIVLLGAYRAAPVNVETIGLVDALTERGALRLAPAPLGDSDAAALVAAVLGAPDRVSRDAVAAAGGNPLLLVELARSSSVVTEGRTPASLHTTVMRRVKHLCAPTIDLLHVASILGTAFDVTHLAAALGRSVVGLLPSLDEAQGAAILSDDRGRLAFRHDLVRQAIYDNIAPAVRRALHLEVGRALARSGVPPLDVAHHLMLGATKGDREAVSWLQDAGRSAASRSPAAAIKLLEAALELLDASDPRRDAIVADMLYPLINAGRLVDAECVARDALGRTSDAAVKDKLRLGLAFVLDRQDRAEDALAESVVVHDGMSALTQVQMKAYAARALLHLGRMEEARQVQGEAMATALRMGDTRALYASQIPLFGMQTWQGDVTAGVEHVRRLIADGERIFGHTNVQPLAFALAHADRLDEAKNLLRRARPGAEERGEVTVLNMYQWRLVHLHFLDGSWDDAIAEGEAALEISRASGLRGILVHGIAILGEIAVHRNELERAEVYLAKSEGGSGEHYRMRACGLLRESQGDLGAALEALDQAWATAAGAGFAVAFTELGPDLVRVLLAVGDRVRARHIAEAISTSADRQRTASAQGAALRSRGLIEDDPRVLVEAVRVMRESPRVLARANTLREAGAALLGTSDRDRGVVLLEEALSVFGELGAEYDIRAVEAILRDAGVARGRRGRRARPTTGWGALTKTELDVVALITRGLTARETGQRLFISPRTVETHVAHIFAKLGLSSRAELRIAYERRQGAAAALPSSRN